MRGIIVGLGSMGKRRLRLLLQLKPDIQLAGVDFSQQRRDEVAEEYNVPCYNSIEAAVQDICPEVGFVCTSPASHCPIIKELLAKGIDVFTELNLVDKGYAELETLAAEKEKVIFMSSTLLYRREIQKIGEIVSKYTGPLSYHLHVGQYLPDWHPWENIKDFFVSNPRTSGCREIFAIQLPWLIKTFGEVDETSIAVRKQRITELSLEYPDSYQVLLNHENRVNGVLQVDVVARKPICALTIVGENIQICWDGTPNSLQVLNLETKQYEQQCLYKMFEQNKKYASNIIEDAYSDEIRCFFQLREKRGAALYTIADDKKTLALIDRIER